jgi:ATP-dependent helicase/nuclease subunit A
VLRLAGVPVSCEATAGYFEATEISDMVCLLKVLDNPQRDIELAAVLRSPLFGVTDTELAKIMIHAGSEQERGNYYDRALLYCRSAADAELAGRLQGILTDLDDWRNVAAIWLI